MAKPIQIAIVNPVLYYLNNPEWITEPSELDEEQFYEEAVRQESVFNLLDLEEEWKKGSVVIDPSVDLLRVYPKSRFNLYPKTK